MYPKFIITASGDFRLGMVHLHKDLLEPGDTCRGGGYYEFNYLQGALELSGESTDFGRPQWDSIETLRIPEPYRGLSLVYFPGSRSGYAVNLAEIVKIEYV